MVSVNCHASHTAAVCVDQTKAMRVCQTGAFFMYAVAQHTS